MPGASSGGSKHKDYSPGSYYSILGNNPEADFPSLVNTTTAAKTSRKRNLEEYVTNSFFDKNKRLEDLQAGPKFLVMKRNEDNKEITLKRVSPFTLQKSIEAFAGEMKNIKRIADGSLLIETFSKKQADRLCVMTKLDDSIKIKIEEHPTLNTTKGTIYCEDLVYLTDEEILEGLQSQHVTDVRRILKKPSTNQIMKRNRFPPRLPQQDDKVVLEDTGVFVLTFNLPTTPRCIKAGINRCDVKLYIPNPRRCFKCQRFGHGKARCSSQQEYCGRCANIQHDEKCTNPAKCTNCAEDHPSWSRQCPRFILEMEVQRIQTIERISNADARKQYMMRNPRIPNPTSTSTTTKLYSTTAKIQTNTLPNINSEDTIGQTVSNSTNPITVNENKNFSHTSNETPPTTQKHIKLNSLKSQNDTSNTHSQIHIISPSQQSQTREASQNTLNIHQNHQRQQGAIPKHSHTPPKSPCNFKNTQDPNGQQLHESLSLRKNLTKNSIEMELDSDNELLGHSGSPENITPIL